MDPDKFELVSRLFPMMAVIAVVITTGWVATTWLRIKHGYPLENSWGQPIHPKVDRENAERIKLLTGENARLRAELGSIADRLETIERIVTDHPHRLAREIDALTLDKGGRA